MLNVINNSMYVYKCLCVSSCVVSLCSSGYPVAMSSLVTDMLMVITIAIYKEYCCYNCQIIITIGFGDN